MRGTRGVSSVISTVLMVGVVVILATTVAASAFGIVDVVQQPSPAVAETSGRLVADIDGSDDQRVRLTIEGGDTLQVRNLEILVDARDACGKTGRLVNLPASGGDLRPTDEYVRGADVFDNSYNSVSGAIGEDGRTVDGTWEAGESILFRLSNSECSIASGETVTVRVIHTPSQSVVIEERLTAE